jgi:hypothetical protein
VACLIYCPIFHSHLGKRALVVYEASDIVGPPLTGPFDVLELVHDGLQVFPLRIDYDVVSSFFPFSSFFFFLFLFA